MTSETRMSYRAFASALRKLGLDDYQAAEFISAGVHTEYSADAVAAMRVGRRTIPPSVAAFLRKRTSTRADHKAPLGLLSRTELVDFLHAAGWSEGRLALELNERLARSYRYQDVSKWCRGNEAVVTLNLDGSVRLGTRGKLVVAAGTGRRVPAAVALLVRGWQEDLRTGVLQPNTDWQSRAVRRAPCATCGEETGRAKARKQEPADRRCGAWPRVLSGLITRHIVRPGDVRQQRDWDAQHVDLRRVELKHDHRTPSGFEDDAHPPHPRNVLPVRPDDIGPFLSPVRQNAKPLRR